MNGHSGLKSVDELVALQAAANPEAMALSYASQTITYKELNDRADALAKMLRGLEVGPEVVVGVCAQRSPAMVIGALAILKAGGAYLPLDPLNPAGRLALMVKDAQISVLVTGPGGEEKLAGEWPTIRLDDSGQIIDAPILTYPKGARLEAVSKTLAYVIYTSGSTGEPNGVEVTHENLLNLVRWHQDAFSVTKATRTSQNASVGFDAAVWEIWPCLAAGGSVHIPAEQVIRDPELLRNWLVAEGITISFVPTPMAEVLLSLKWPGQTALRIMLTGADTLRRYPPTGLPFELVNNYGPTECTVVATSGRILPEGTKNGLPSIGRPITNTQIYILDESGRPLPAGTEGELYIGGAGIGRGYRNRPELTAKRFVADPFAAQPGGRLFKTGDIARMLPNGEVAFVRRMDDQIKVRGFRIEPNEIAAVLNQHPRVRQGVVVARETEHAGKHLVGYVVPGLDGLPRLSELRDFLRARLPDYMVPDIFVKLESLPLSTNGKINRPELAAPNELNTLRDEAFAAPRNDLEKKVAEILGGLLGVEGVGVDANFFDLGGHSLVGAQLIARIRSTFGVEMKLRALFEGPTVAKVAAEIQRLLVLKQEKAKDNPVQSLPENGVHAGVGH
jgi:amino acid adenylation domain-containing protein